MANSYTGTLAQKRALSTFVCLVRAASAIGTRTTTHLADDKLSASQFSVLEALYHLGPLSQRQLAEKLLVTGGNITFLIDNLEKRELVKRVRSEEDRRSYQIHLTRAGQVLTEKVFPRHQDMIVDLFDCLSVSEQEELKRICKKLGKQA